ncbi:phosphatidate cytidylyltransferase [Candidatus Saccharibacteria bacterium]|nr:phosphatidate cytidylyltransferase [Candidatus Saccharibacteria bacterium]
MDKNFRVRTLCGMILFLAALLMLYTFDGLPLKIFFGIFATIAGIELLSFLQKKVSFCGILLMILEIVFLVVSSIFVTKIGVMQVWYIIFGVCGYDIFAYLFGKTLGGKIVKNTRPFPHISKNKTWEGTIFGLTMAVLLVSLLMFLTKRQDYVYLLCGPLAVVGDLFESFLKRQFNVKDSNEILIKNKVFDKLELIVGGSKGHGGFLDRIDSLAFTMTILMLLV